MIVLQLVESCSVFFIFPPIHKKTIKYTPFLFAKSIFCIIFAISLQHESTDCQYK